MEENYYDRTAYFANLNDEEIRVLDKYQIGELFAKELKKLREFKLVLICDDSISMDELLINGQTKWDSLKQTLEVVLDIANAFKVECDVLFINRPGLANCKNFYQLKMHLMNPPNGENYLTNVVQTVFLTNRNELFKRKLLLIIFTDGCPISDRLSQKDGIKEFKNLLENRKPIDKLFVTIVACTDNPNAIKYLNKWDVQIKNLDVIENYENEAKQILEVSELDAFSYGDYVAKILLGSFIKHIDKLDEKPKTCSII